MAKVTITFSDTDDGCVKTKVRFIPEMERSADGLFHLSPAQRQGYAFIEAICPEMIGHAADDETATPTS